MNMKKLACVVSILLCVGCNVTDPVSDQGGVESVKSGTLSVSVEYESMKTKAPTEYTSELNEEKMIRDVTVLVFDKSTGQLSAYDKLNSLAEEIVFTVSAGEKTVYVLVNGPDLGSVRNIEQMLQVVDDLNSGKLNDDGLAMLGCEDCYVSAKNPAEPVVIVRRLAARVVLKKVTNNIPGQYGKMTVDCVYLGYANLKQSLSGNVTGMANLNGYADEDMTKPIGKDGEVGAAATYLYRSIGKDIAVGASSDEKYHMYCHPNDSQNHTCLYLLVTIDGSQYYYRVPLNKGLAANTTSSVELEITNLGYTQPPVGDMQKDAIFALVNIAGWDASEEYQVEF